MFAKALAIETRKGYATKTFFDHPSPLFHIISTPHSDIATAVTREQASLSINYLILGYNNTNSKWDVYVGETGGVFKDRFQTHKNSSWFKNLDEKTLLFLIVDVPTEGTIDFRKTLEYQLSVEAAKAGLNVLNTTGSEQTILGMVENSLKLESIAKLVIDFLCLQRTIKLAPPETLPEVFESKPKRKETKKYEIGTKLTFSHKKFGVTTTVKATVVENNKVIVTDIINAPKYSLYNPTGKKFYERYKPSVEKFLLTAETTTNLYTWSGSSNPMSLTLPLALASGTGVANLWHVEE